MFYSFFLRAHEHIYFMECAMSQNVYIVLFDTHISHFTYHTQQPNTFFLSQNVLLPLLMVHFVTRMYYYYYYYYYYFSERTLTKFNIVKIHNKNSLHFSISWESFYSRGLNSLRCRALSIILLLYPTFTDLLAQSLTQGGLIKYV